jgi:hypothetical protein
MALRPPSVHEFGPPGGACRGLRRGCARAAAAVRLPPQAAPGRAGWRLATGLSQASEIA